MVPEPDRDPLIDEVVGKRIAAMIRSWNADHEVLEDMLASVHPSYPERRRALENALALHSSFKDIHERAFRTLEKRDAQGTRPEGD